MIKEKLAKILFCFTLILTVFVSGCGQIKKSNTEIKSKQVAKQVGDSKKYAMIADIQKSFIRNMVKVLPKKPKTRLEIIILVQNIYQNALRIMAYI